MSKLIRVFQPQELPAMEAMATVMPVQHDGSATNIRQLIQMLTTVGYKVQSPREPTDSIVGQWPTQTPPSGVARTVFIHYLSAASLGKTAPQARIKSYPPATENNTLKQLEENCRQLLKETPEFEYTHQRHEITHLLADCIKHVQDLE